MMNEQAPQVGMIWTIRGWMREAELTKTSGTDEDQNSRSAWEEWRAADGEIVKRNAHVMLKR